jgi:hypothetical protein
MTKRFQHVVDPVHTPQHRSRGKGAHIAETLKQLDRSCALTCLIAALQQQAAPVAPEQLQNGHVVLLKVLASLRLHVSLASLTLGCHVGDLIWGAATAGGALDALR